VSKWICVGSPTAEYPIGQCAVSASLHLAGVFFYFTLRQMLILGTEDFFHEALADVL
jgi:hypothetical protein